MPWGYTMGSIRMPDPVRKKNADGSIKSDVWSRSSLILAASSGAGA